jgi:acetylglutamate kinase
LSRLLIKLGGALLDDRGSRERLAAEIAKLPGQVVVVHGGGKQMNRFLAERGVESRFVNGLRVTTPEILDAVLKVFAGTVNAELVSAFRAAGARPVGLTGLDAGLVDAVPLDPDLGHVGRPVQCNARLLELLTANGYLPVVACLAGDPGGAMYNVNGDQMASACAAAFGAEKLVFLTDVDGVRDGSGNTLATLTAGQARGLIREGVANGGMQAKLEAAMGALAGGAGEIHIAPGARPGAVGRLLNGEAVGTRLVA